MISAGTFFSCGDRFLKTLRGRKEMKTLIVEDDLTSRLLLQDYLKDFGPTHVAVNGREAVEATRLALEACEPYDLICLDVMMPEMDGMEALNEIRNQEEASGIISSRGAKIIMTTALDDPRNIISAFAGLCDIYLLKPIDKSRLLEALRKVNLFS
jgi:two-component system, chemotaxis family, chemotaxis protein CheY